MKLVWILVAMACLVTGVLAQNQMEVAKYLMESLQKGSSMVNPIALIQNVCKMQTKVSDRNLKKVKNGDFSSTNLKLKTYVFCVYISLGMMTGEAEIVKESALKLSPEDTDPVMFQKAVDACMLKEPKSIAERAYAVVKCFNSKYPNHIMVL